MSDHTPTTVVAMGNVRKGSFPLFKHQIMSAETFVNLMHNCFEEHDTVTYKLIVWKRVLSQSMAGDPYTLAWWDLNCHHDSLHNLLEAFQKEFMSADYRIQREAEAKMDSLDPHNYSTVAEYVAAFWRQYLVFKSKHRKTNKWLLKSNEGLKLRFIENILSNQLQFTLQNLNDEKPDLPLHDILDRAREEIRKRHNRMQHLSDQVASHSSSDAGARSLGEPIEFHYYDERQRSPSPKRIMAATATKNREEEKMANAIKEIQDS
ncbi:hypothetical protein HDU96_004574, partial [Phlyctochytrium bullatum]